MSTRRASLLVTALTALLLAGCAGTGTGTGSGPGVGSSSGAPDAAVGSASPGPSASGYPEDLPLVAPTTKPSKPAFPEDPKAKAGPQVVTGTVTAGVEPNCRLLQGYLLNFANEGARAAAPVGARVTVVGQAQPDMVTTCQQGTPLLVTEVRPG